ncbi:MAG TPA: CBS domain-containing protein [Thermoanaerobaculia bacterium]|jgi:CBS domain-containing protein|nr:CBS domain-containing protein [Thermoanaerobaculia bacterium]
MRPITASDLMNPRVLTVSRDLRVSELANFLVAHDISGAPVVDGSGKLVGVVSLNDIAEVLADDEEEDGDRGTDFFASEWDEGLSREEIEELPPDAGELTVVDIMTPEVFTVGEETTVSEIAGTMIASHVHRLLVTREDRVVGIISTSDLLGLLVEEKE